MSVNLLFLHFAGFLLQTLPFAFLACLPFLNHLIYGGKKQILCFCSAGLTFAALVFTLLMNYLYTRDGSGFANMRGAADMYFLVVLLITAGYIYRHTQELFIKKLLVYMTVIHYGAVIFTFVTPFVNISSSIFYDPTYTIYNKNVGVNLLLLIVSYPLVALFMRNTMARILPAMDRAAAQRGCLYLVSVMFLYCLCIFTMTNRTAGFLDDRDMLLFLTSVLATDAIVYYMYFSELKVSLTNQELNQQLESFQTQYEKITSSIEDARKIRHDLQHHLNVIRSMLQENRLEDLDCYLTQYTRSIDEVSQQKYTACPLLDSILNYYMQRCTSACIPIEIDAVVVKAPPIEAIDLTVLLGNALENAIQESELTELADIQIYIRYVDEYLLIRVENECNYKADSGMIVPKKHSQKHSYGMINMRTVCEKYGGNAAFYKADTKFIASFILYP